MTGECVENGSDAAAYSLGALDRSESAAFARHADTCVVCRDELVAFAEVTERIALTAPQLPAPRRLRRSVLAAVRASTVQANTVPASTVGSPRRPAPRVRRTGRVMLAGLAGGLAGVALAVGGHAALTPAGPAAARTVAARVSEAGGRAELRLAGGHAELVVAGLRQPAPGDVYEVWLVRRPGSAPQPTNALFGVTARGSGTVEVPGDLRSVSEVLVTQEPSGGSSVPTGAALIRARI